MRMLEWLILANADSNDVVYQEQTNTATWSRVTESNYGYSLPSDDTR